MGGESAFSQSRTRANLQQQPELATLRSRWREPLTASAADYTLGLRVGVYDSGLAQNPAYLAGLAEEIRYVRGRRPTLLK
jgi:hypothetical protein